MKIRAHRGGLAESMATVAEITATKEAVAAHVSAAWEGWPDSDVTPEMVRVEKYGEGVDSRIGWDTHIVLIDGRGPFGFTDGPLTPNAVVRGGAFPSLSTNLVKFRRLSMKQINVTLKIKTGEEDRLCSRDCNFLDTFSDECHIFGEVKKVSNTDNVWMGEYIRHRTCRKKEI